MGRLTHTVAQLNEAIRRVFSNWADVSETTAKKEDVRKGKMFVGADKTLQEGTLEASEPVAGDGFPILVYTESEMWEILANATENDAGKIYKYLGATGSFQSGEHYIISDGGGADGHYLEIVGARWYCSDDGVDTSNYIKLKIDTAPTNENDYDVIAEPLFKKDPVITGKTKWNGARKVYIWSFGTYQNKSEYLARYWLDDDFVSENAPKAPEGYANAAELVITKSTTLNINPFWNNGPI